MSRLLVDVATTTASSKGSFEQLEDDLAIDFSRKIDSYSDVLLLRHALRHNQSQFHHSLYSVNNPSTARILDLRSLTAISHSALQDSFRAVLEGAINRYIPLLVSPEPDYGYLAEDEAPSQVIPSNLAQVRVTNEDDIDLPWA